MVCHIVLFRPHAKLTVEDRRTLADAFATARQDIPSIRRFHIGRRARVGAGYEDAMPEELTHAAVVEFDDRDGLEAYLQHASHDALGTLFGSMAECALIYDFEMTDDPTAIRQLALDEG